MADPGKQPSEQQPPGTQSSSGKQSSRWGSFFQQAVAGIESNLDTILAGEDMPQGANQAVGGASKTETRMLSLPPDPGLVRDLVPNALPRL